MPAVPLYLMQLEIVCAKFLPHKYNVLLTCAACGKEGCLPCGPRGIVLVYRVALGSLVMLSISLSWELSSSESHLSLNREGLHCHQGTGETVAVLYCSLNCYFLFRG